MRPVIASCERMAGSRGRRCCSGGCGGDCSVRRCRQCQYAPDGRRVSCRRCVGGTFASGRKEEIMTRLESVAGVRSDDSPIEPSGRTTLTDIEVATRLGVSRFTLRSWRLKGVGPRFLKMGRAVRYRPAGRGRVRTAGSRRDASTIRSLADVIAACAGTLLARLPANSLFASDRASNRVAGAALDGRTDMALWKRGRRYWTRLLGQRRADCAVRSARRARLARRRTGKRRSGSRRN